MGLRPPSDGVVALRSLGRRFRALFAGLSEDEALDDLARRTGAGGHSALDHVVGTSRTLRLLGRALDRVLVEDDPLLDPGVDTAQRAGEHLPVGTVEERLTELASEADALAQRAGAIPAADWARTGRIAGHEGTTTASALLWDAVDSAIAHLKAAEHTLAEVRQQR